MESSANSKRRAENSLRILAQGDKPQLSIHSEGRIDNQTEGSEKFFSFNQSFTNTDHNDKIGSNKSQTKLKVLEDQVKIYKAKSSLWEKAKAQILNLNKFLKLSSVSLGCSDSSVMKQFFESVTLYLEEKNDKSNQDKSAVAQAKRKEAELFQKLVETNKKKYELEQKIVQYQHEISKLSEVNDSLRQKSRAQSTQRSSKIKQFHQETILTIHQKQGEVTALQEKNDELKRQVASLQQNQEALMAKIYAFQSLLTKKQQDYQLLLTKKNQENLYQSTKKDEETKLLLEKRQEENRLLNLECESLRTEIKNMKRQQLQAEAQINEIKDYLRIIVDENVVTRTELTKRGQYIQSLRKIIDEAKNANQEYLQYILQKTKQEELKRQQNISKLLQSEASAMKLNLKANCRFAINRSKRNKRSGHPIKSTSSELLPSQELLI